MFTNISLCPGGAMMMHESVAEFDPNMGNPMESEAVQEKISEELKEQGTMYCPVAKVLNRIEPLYERAQQLMRINLQPETAEEAIASLDEISATATDFAECMRMMMVKLQAVYCYIGQHNSSWTFEPIHEHLGFFIKNYNRLISQGYGTVVVNCEDFPALESYTVERALTLYINSLDGNLPSYPFDINRIYALTNYDKGQNVFLNTEDLFKCLINDPERRARLSNTRVANHELESLIRRCGHDDNIYDTCDDNFARRMSTMLCQHISKTLRMVKQGCYNLQCDMMNESNMEPQHIHSQMRSLIAGTVDMLYLPALYLISIAFRMKCDITTKEAMNAYVDQVLTAMKASD